MAECQINDQNGHDQYEQSLSINSIKANLNRLERVIRGPYVRPADFATRDRLARRLRDAR